MRLSEWDEIPYIIDNKEKLHEFADFLNEVWQSRTKYIEEESSDNEGWTNNKSGQRFFDITFDGELYARNYVGIVQYENIKIEIYPKLLKEKSNPKPKWQLNLMYWLSYCRKTRFPFSHVDISDLPADNFLELLIYIFANYTYEILSQQPFQSYQLIEEETPFLKGRLLFNSYIKNNVVTGQWQQFQCEHEPFIYDNLFNRIVKYVAKKLMLLSKNDFNIKKLETVLFLLDDVSDSYLTVQDCNKVILGPLFNDHQNILSLCKLYLSNRVIDIQDEKNKNFCFLIPMEYVFEDFIFGFINDKWPSLNLKYQTQEWLTAGKEFWIRNDLYVENHLIIDTKYKIRDLDSNSKGGVGQPDLYQMITYAIGRSCKNGLLLYPGTSEKKHSFDVPSQLLHEDINIQAKNIDITFDDIEHAEQLIIMRIKHLSELFE
jgi:5-methylcytosine-specific restriction enzyme subunit McrC